MKRILRLVGYYNKTIASHTTNIFIFTFWSLPERPSRSSKEACSVPVLVIEM